MVKYLLKYHVSTKSYLILKFRNVVKFYVHIRPLSHAGLHIIFLFKRNNTLILVFISVHEVNIPRFYLSQKLLVSNL